MLSITHKDVTLPNGLTKIGDNAFFECSNLTSITIPDTVTTIEKGAFSTCRKLERISIPSSVTTIGDDAFKECDSLTIYGKSGSYTETYAKKNGIPFNVE